MASSYIKNKQRLKGIRYMLLSIAAANALITIVLGLISSFFKDPIPMYLESLIIGLCAYLIPLVIYAKTTGVTAEAAEEMFYLRRSKKSLLLLSLLLGICWQFVMIVINLPVNLLLNGSDSYIPQSALELMAAIFVVGIIPAVFEELLFRGIVDGSMSEFNTKTAVIFSSVMFAVLHADIFGFMGYIFMGAILTSIVRRTGSVYSAMLFHFANNTTALLLGYFSDDLGYAPILTITIFVLGVIGFLALYSIFIAATKKPDTVTKMKNSTLLGQSFINLPILLCIFLIIATFIIIRII